MESLGEIEQLDLSALVVRSNMTGNKLAQTARINVSDSRQVQDDLISTFRDQTADRLFQRDIAPADSDVAVHIQDGHVADSTLMDVKGAHINSPRTPSEAVLCFAMAGRGSSNSEE